MRATAHNASAKPVARPEVVLSPSGRPNTAHGGTPEQVAIEEGIGYGALVCHSMMREHPVGSPEWAVLKQARDRLLEEAGRDWLRALTRADLRAVSR